MKIRSSFLCSIQPLEGTKEHASDYSKRTNGSEQSNSVNLLRGPYVLYTKYKGQKIHQIPFPLLKCSAGVSMFLFRLVTPPRCAYRGQIRYNGSNYTQNAVRDMYAI